MQDREVFKAVIIKKTAEIEGVSPSSVRRVMKDKQTNEHVFHTYLVLEEKFNESIEETKLISAVNKLIPFFKTPNQ
ncbi:MAG: hypothetical protein WKF85_06585 [Chitinophagaceae bacterium]